MAARSAALNIDETAQRLKSLQEAITDGRGIEYWSRATEGWETWTGNIFTRPLHEYRPKKVEPVEKVWYVNRYLNSDSDGRAVVLHATRTDADRYAGEKRVACVKLTMTYVPGQYDE